MSELSCEVKNCSYNRDCYCCKGDILVGGAHADEKESTCCESYMDRKNDSYISALDHPSKTIGIDCEAVRCVYNSNYRCQAEHVDIKRNSTGTETETLCGTFRENE